MNEIIKSAINRVKLKGENIWTRYSYWTKAKDVELENGETVEDKILDINTNLLNHVANKSNPHNVTKVQLELENVDNTKDEDKIVSTLQREAIDMSYQQSTGYTDKKIADLIGSAPTTLDTLEEIAKAMQENDDVVTALHESIGSKATQAELDGLQTELGKKVTTGSQAKLYNVGLGNSSTALIYSEKDNVNFRFKGENGDTQYTNIKKITGDIDDLSNRGNYTELGRYFSYVGNEEGTISANLSAYRYLVFNFIFDNEIIDSKILPRQLFTDYCSAYPIKLTFGNHQAQVRHGNGIYAFVNSAHCVVAAYGIK